LPDPQLQKGEDKFIQGVSGFFGKSPFFLWHEQCIREGDSVKMAARKLKAELGYEILAYLLRHPETQDTVQGIVEWWLLEQRIVRAKAEVKAALDELVSRKWRAQWQVTAGRVYYQLDPKKKKQIAALLKLQPKLD
jgi:hypothetical protein